MITSRGPLLGVGEGRPQAGYDILGGARFVELWSSVRLPFEPRGWVRDARDELRERLRGLVAAGDEILSAEYTSEDDSFCDVENILIYNVGAAPLRGATQNGLVFRRSRSKAPPSPSKRRYRHHHRYALEPPATLGVVGDSVCHFEFELERLNTGTKPHEVWWSAARSERGEPTCGAASRRFGLEVVLHAPVRPPNVAGLLKPLLDGIISALHCQPHPSPEAVLRLSKALGVPVPRVESALASPANPILGEQELLQPYRSFVKWNPADELCEHCRLMVHVGGCRNFRCRVDVSALPSTSEPSS